MRVLHTYYTCIHARYQGEANEKDESYRCTFPGMITSWRRHWSAAPSPNTLGFPFLFVQLAPYVDQQPYSCLMEGGPGGGAGGPGTVPYVGTLPRARLRQLAALLCCCRMCNVGMAAMAVDLADSASPFWPGSVQHTPGTSSR